ncbi:SUMF1/EgtB/PvdO family nonheme iron enzyme [Methylocystis sp. H4A]|uniref:nSTAND1 domain-containing NTPase n=1 Tax=Methylocystis sp. H4A TaxID=2785788 RepID=UPI0018C2779F|nr:SUMF1/EgtB/PvdO family nonheme iron enzyme [Methylocystis sp. H4A]MBG0802203.1 SUMF1/EgtB/PvdO family nonheme iron enzyme [Methylocystis sp. H4A]
MAKLFISHSSYNDEWAIALRDWLMAEGWSGPDDIFLDLDPERGIAGGQRWQQAFADAATRCEAVLFLVSAQWLASHWCHDEYQLANKYNKKLFALLIDDTPLETLPGGLTAQWQIVRLKGEPAERFIAVHPYSQKQWPVHISKTGLTQLKSGLQKAGVGPENFDLQRDENGIFGWRSPYRGLEALEPEDAAVFFGRRADLVRGMDTLRGLATRAPPRVAVILGASGAGKSSFLRAGLWPRLSRDDAQWLPLKVIRAARGGAIEGQEGLLAALLDVHLRFALRSSRSQLRERLQSADGFVSLLRELRQVAAKRALLTEPPFPLPVICLDQGEELFASDEGKESERLLLLARAASEADEALILITIRSDAYSRMQTAKAFAGIDQVPISLGPMPQGELASIIREPAEILRRKVGPDAPVFDAAVVERLQAELEGEPDALPLLAFVLQRLMREHAGEGVIGLSQIHRSGGLAEAIELEAEAAFSEAGYAHSRNDRREALRKLFIPPLVRINRESNAAQRHVASQTELSSELLPLARALTERRLLVVRATLAVAKGAFGGATDVERAANGSDHTPITTIEVAHEALFRHWSMLAELLGEDRDALLLLDGVLLSAEEWSKTQDLRKADFLLHRGSRLAKAQALGFRGPNWAREIAAAKAYLAACAERESAEKWSKRRSKAIVGVLLVVIGTGGLAVYNFDRLRLASYWFFNVRPYVKSQADEKAYSERQVKFKECLDCPEMISIASGEFRRGGPLLGSPAPDRETPISDVKIRKSFAVSVTEITFSQWDFCASQGVCRSNLSSSEWGRENQDAPVMKVSWEDAQTYIKWISALTGKRYRLLSEAEWEFAARGGTTSGYSFPEPSINQYAWYESNSKGKGSPHPVGKLKPNPSGLKDMHGNVAEWVEDCFHDNYNGAPLTEAAWTTGRFCNHRVVRGGHWQSDAKALRSASRDWQPINDDSSDQIGFRIARELDGSASSD